MNKELGFIPYFYCRCIPHLIVFLYEFLLSVKFAATLAPIVIIEHSLHSSSPYHILDQLRMNTEKCATFIFMLCHHLCQTATKRTRVKETTSHGMPYAMKNATCGKDCRSSGIMIEWE